MAAFALETFEPRAEAFAQARAWREWAFVSGQRPGRGLVSLYEQDFPELTSTDLWADLQAATSENPRQHRALSALLASAYLEGRTRDFAIRATRVEAGATISFEDADIPWTAAPARWLNLAEVPRRHELEESWRAVTRAELNPTLERWQESLRAELAPMGATDWLAFWSNLRGIDLGQTSKLAETLLESTADVYGHALGVYLAQLDLPIDDAWTSDAEWACRAPRFDVDFPEHSRMPVLIGALGDLGVELLQQTGLRLDYVAQPGVRIIPLQIPDEIHLLTRLVGGWQDYASGLFGLGAAEHFVQADRTLSFWECWLGDRSPTIAYGLLLEGLTRDRIWLANRAEFEQSDDFRAIAHIAWLYRLRGVAATALYEQRLWLAEPGAVLAADFEESLSGAARIRHFREPYLRVLHQAPWSALSAAVALRAEVFAAQVRQFLIREFDEEWWRSPRAARFIRDELWRPAGRHTPEELLGFMGFEGFDPAILGAEFEEVLRPL